METFLAQADRPTAVSTASDVVALGAIRTIREHRLRIPEDISVVGFDDIPLAQYLEPGLTTRSPASGGVRATSRKNADGSYQCRSLSRKASQTEHQADYSWFFSAAWLNGLIKKHFNHIERRSTDTQFTIANKHFVNQSFLLENTQRTRKPGSLL